MTAMDGPPTRRARALGAALALLGVLTAAGLVDGHALLSRSDPPAASTLRVAPGEVRLWFTESLEPTFSAAHLVDGARRRVDAAVGRVDPLDAALLRMTLPALAAGTYTVVYRVVSVDSHVTSGELSFRIVP